VARSRLASPVSGPPLTPLILNARAGFNSQPPSLLAMPILIERLRA
jgi:hypothetical protein